MAEPTISRRALLAAASAACAAAYLPGCGDDEARVPLPGSEGGDEAILTALHEATRDLEAMARTRAVSLEGELAEVVGRIAQLSRRQSGALAPGRASMEPAASFVGTPKDAIDTLRERVAALTRTEIDAISRLRSGEARVTVGAVLNSHAQALSMLLAVSGRSPVPHAFVPDG